MPEHNGNHVEIPSSAELEALRDHYRYRGRFLKTLISTIAVLIVIAAIAVLLSSSLIPVLRIYGSAMSPTLEEGEVVVAIKDDNIKVGDIAAFYYGNKLLIKRVIAGPGDRVAVNDNGDVYVNDELLDEPYVTTKAFGECDQTFPIEVGEERWFMMGDNRLTSVDSRSTLIGCVSEEQIAGRVVFRIWPINKLGTVK